ncbi:MAG: ATP-binding protein [Euryarchaeota archaeon]|nr:ATP-binding protein [Euryarchaeota archaeon]
MELVEALPKVNEWWSLGGVPAELAPPRRRRLLAELLGVLDDRRIICINGPRRSGKTTLMYQLIDMLIRERGVAPRDILFFSGDDAGLRSHDDLIEKAVTAYFEEVAHGDHREGRRWIFIDEVHKIKGWQLWLKKFYDLKYAVKFIISGSSASKLRSGQRESLAGRMIEYPLFPMSFSEFLDFNGVRPAERSSVFDIDSAYVARHRTRKRPVAMTRLFAEYLLAGGFPEWFETGKLRLWHRKLLEDTVKRVLYDDIAEAYGVKNRSKLEAMLLKLAGEPERVYSYNSLGNSLGLDNETAERFVRYLRESFLLFEMRNYATSVDKQLRKNYKYVLVDIGMKHALTRTSALGPQEAGQAVESAVLQHLHWAAEAAGDTVSYRSGDGSVDAVVRSAGSLLPVEVKYRSDVRKEDLAGILDFMERFKAARGIVVTKGELRVVRNGKAELLLVPAWLFLSSL